MAELRGTPGSDNIEGTGQDDMIFGLAGDDTIRGRRGNDIIDGGDGLDEISFRGEGVTSGIRIDFINGTATDGLGGTDLFVNIERVNGTDFNDTMIGSDRAEAFRGRGGSDTIIAGGGNDRIGISGGNDQIDGGNGTDVVNVESVRADVTIQKDGGGDPISITSAQGQDTLANVERLEFQDGTLAYDVGERENAGSAYRLYQAAFGRDPDVEGLGYWIRHLDAGKSNLDAVAHSFLNSPEFSSRYGNEETVSDSQFIELLYQNALGRDSDQEGFNYWVEKLTSNQTNRGDLLAFFSESAENRAGTAPETADGVWYV